MKTKNTLIFFSLIACLFVFCSKVEADCGEVDSLQTSYIDSITSGVVYLHDSAQCDDPYHYCDLMISNNGQTPTHDGVWSTSPNYALYRNEYIANTACSQFGLNSYLYTTPPTTPGNYTLYSWVRNHDSGNFVQVWAYTNLHWDGSQWTAVPINPSLSISSPTNGTTITSNSTTISGTYGALNEGFYGYGYLHIELKNPNSGLYSQIYTKALTSGTGSFSFPVSTFGITENGTWDLQATQELDANTFQDLTPSPAYTLNFNISGNSTPYTFTNWNTWYSANSAGGYSAPSDFGNSIEGFFQPIFTNVYEFANNTLSFFNATTAHDKGYQIGQIFSTGQAYLDNINVFFGGFPLVPFFEFMIVVMLGIFIVRTIFKFIPFFG